MRPQKPRFQCHSRYGKIKIPPCSKSTRADCNPSPAALYELNIPERNDKRSAINFKRVGGSNQVELKIKKTRWAKDSKDFYFLMQHAVEDHRSSTASSSYASCRVSNDNFDIFVDYFRRYNI